MEHIGHLLEANGRTPLQQNSYTNSARVFTIRKNIRRMFINFDMPEKDRLELLVEDALRLWKEIPDSSIEGAVEAAIIDAGSFPATTGLVAKIWRDGRNKPLELGANRPRLGDKPLMIEPEESQQATPEQVDEFLKGARKRVQQTRGME